MSIDSNQVLAIRPQRLSMAALEVAGTDPSQHQVQIPCEVRHRTKCFQRGSDNSLTTEAPPVGSFRQDDGSRQSSHGNAFRACVRLSTMSGYGLQ